MAVNRFLVFQFFLWLILAQGGYSQGEKPKEKVVKCELMTLSLNGIITNLHYSNKGDAREMSATPQAITRPSPYQGSQILRFYRSAAELEASKAVDSGIKPIARVRLPDSSDRVLLVFAMTGKKKVVKVTAYDASVKGMDAGEYRVFNFSKRGVGAAFGDDKKITVAPKKDKVVSSSKWKKKILDMQVQFFVSDKGKSKLTYSSVWGHRPERRMFLFLFDRNDQRRPIEVRSYFDLPGVVVE